MIGIGQIIKHRQIDREDPNGDASDCKTGHDPVYRGEGCPPEPEHARRHQNRLDAYKN